MPERWGLQGVSSAELRQMYVDWHLRPCLRDIVRRAPRTTNLLVCVAQFYNDNANDEVHILPLAMEEPWDGQWPPHPPAFAFEEVWREEELLGFEDEERAAWRSDPERALDALQSWRWTARFQLLDAEGRPWRPRLGYLAPAPAFAPFCKPGANQHMVVSESFAPLLHVTLPDWRLRWVGAMQQPEIEDNFLCNSVRYEHERVEAAPDLKLPLPALRELPRIEGRVRELLGACRRFTEQERAGEAGDASAITRFVGWANLTLGEHNNSPW